MFFANSSEKLDVSKSAVFLLIIFAVLRLHKLLLVNRTVQCTK